jgi:hypothetical protein
MREDNVVRLRRAPETDAAGNDNHQTLPDGATIDEFIAYLPSHTFFYMPTRETWPAASVNAIVKPITGGDGKPIKPSVWLDRHHAAQQMTWAPGMPLEIKDQLIADGGWFPHPGSTVINTYRPPTLKHEPGDVKLWIDHVRLLYGEDADHIVLWLGHRVQRPGEKINHAVLLGGGQGIGKDTLLEPVKQAVGPWNCIEVSPKQIVGRFNSWAKCVILRISEARDLGDIDRYGFYEASKTLMAAPPDVLRVDEKHLREYSIMNVCGVVLTTNHKASGIYLPPDDRRHYVAWSERTREEFDAAYWEQDVVVVRARRHRGRGAPPRDA